MLYQTYILTDESVVVMLKENGVMRSVPVPFENPMYLKVRTALDNHEFDGIPELVDLAASIRKHSSGRFMVSNGSVFIDKDMLPDVLSARLIDFVEHNPPLNTTPLERFWDNLKANPSLRSREMLYAFLEHNGIPVTADGCFVAYKRVDADFKDCYTHTFDNSVGVVVKMDRARVDPDPTRTCSTGLHVAAFVYAKDFGSGHLMEVKVNPLNVVAVPNDYNGQKMRVCEYEVMRECEEPRPDDECLYDYDDTADQDVWNDTDWDDDVDDNVDDNVDDVDDNVDDVDDVVDDNVDLSPVTVVSDSRGRVCIPSRFVKALGLSENSTAYAYVYGGYNDVSVVHDKNEDTSAEAVRAYIVDKDGNVRISAYTLVLANIGDCKKYKISIYSDTIKVQAG